LTKFPELKITSGKKFFILTVSLFAVMLFAGHIFSSSTEDWLAVCYGCGVSLGLSWVGFMLLMKVPGQDAGTFMKLVLGGMAARLLAALGLIALGIAGLDLPAGRLVGSCMLSYIVFITLEHVFALSALKPKDVHTS